MKYILLLGLTLFLQYFEVVAQVHNCHAPIDLNRSAKVQELLNHSNNKNYSGQSPMIRLALHNVHRDDGSGGYNWVDIRTVTEGISAFFSPFDICFTVVEENDIDNTTYYDLTSTASPDWNDLIEEDRVENAINIYFISEGSFGGRATGFEFGNPFPSVTLSNRVVNPDFDIDFLSFNSEVLAHELGHCLGLRHTHQFRFADPADITSAQIREQIHRTGTFNGIAANCITEGDFLCDTPADFNLNFNIDNVFNENTCVYTGNATLNGQSYAPDTRNIMSYTLPTCMLNFTQGQGNRMRNFILNSTVLDDYVIREDRTVEGTIFAANRYYGVEGTITTSANHIYPNVLYEAGEAVNLEVGFDIDASTGGSMEATIGDYSCLEPLTRNDARIGNPNQPIATTNGVSIIKSGNVAVEEIFDETLAVSPNPFNNSFNLGFDLAKTQAVSLVVYDALGRVVETVLMNDNLQRGNHFYKINGANLENGLYYVTLKHSSGTQTIKVIKQ